MYSLSVNFLESEEVSSVRNECAINARHALSVIDSGYADFIGGKDKRSSFPSQSALQ